MRPFNEFVTKREAILKAYRAGIRLKHSLAADEEIARTLPDVEAAIDTALLNGEPLAIDIATAFAEGV